MTKLILVLSLLLIPHFLLHSLTLSSVTVSVTADAIFPSQIVAYPDIWLTNHFNADQVNNTLDIDSWHDSHLEYPPESWTLRASFDAVAIQSAEFDRPTITTTTQPGVLFDNDAKKSVLEIVPTSLDGNVDSSQFTLVYSSFTLFIVYKIPTNSSCLITSTTNPRGCLIYGTGHIQDTEGDMGVFVNEHQKLSFSINLYAQTGVSVWSWFLPTPIIPDAVNVIMVHSDVIGNEMILRDLSGTVTGQYQTVGTGTLGIGASIAPTFIGGPQPSNTTSSFNQLFSYFEGEMMEIALYDFHLTQQPVFNAAQRDVVYNYLVDKWVPSASPDVVDSSTGDASTGATDSSTGSSETVEASSAGVIDSSTGEEAPSSTGADGSSTATEPGSSGPDPTATSSTGPMVVDPTSSIYDPVQVRMIFKSTVEPGAIEAQIRSDLARLFDLTLDYIVYQSTDSSDNSITLDIYSTARNAPVTQSSTHRRNTVLMQLHQRLFGIQFLAVASSPIHEVELLVEWHNDTQSVLYNSTVFPYLSNLDPSKKVEFVTLSSDTATDSPGQTNRGVILGIVITLVIIFTIATCVVVYAIHKRLSSRRHNLESDQLVDVGGGNTMVSRSGRQFITPIELGEQHHTYLNNGGISSSSPDGGRHEAHHIQISAIDEPSDIRPTDEAFHMDGLSLSDDHENVIKKEPSTNNSGEIQVTRVSAPIAPPATAPSPKASKPKKVKKNKKAKKKDEADADPDSPVPPPQQHHIIAPEQDTIRSVNDEEEE